MWHKLWPVGNGANSGRALAANNRLEQGSRGSDYHLWFQLQVWYNCLEYLIGFSHIEFMEEGYLG